MRGSVPDPARLEAGLVFERVLEDGLKQKVGDLVDRAGEFRTAEGIYFTPDLLIDEPITRIGEVKLTWMSSRDVPRESARAFPPKFDKYFTQIKGYCHGLGIPHARLYSLFVNGDYRGYTPEMLAWDIEFSARELQENWTMLMHYARKRGMCS